MIRLALASLIFVGTAQAETCKPPNVARTVYPLSARQLACPTEGPCQRVYQHGMETHLDVICLTPAQNTEAEARWR